MIDKICMFLTNRIRKEMPEIDDEKAEVINYGLQNIIGEIPKIFIMLIIAYILGIFPLALFTFIVLLPYRGASGGIHLKTHLGCIFFTTLFYCAIPFISQYISLVGIAKYLTIASTLIVAYAPVATSSIISLLGLINSNISKFTNSYSGLCSVLTAVLVYFAIKALYDEKEDNKAIKTFFITMAIYYAFVFVLKLFGLYI